MVRRPCTLCPPIFWEEATIVQAYTAVWRRWYWHVLVLVASYLYPLSSLFVLWGIFVGSEIQIDGSMGNL